MPFDASRYPANWKEISAALRAEAGVCEWCGAPNHKLIIRVKREPGFVVYDPDNPADFEEEHYHSGFEARITRVVLTVAHLGTPIRLPNGELQLTDPHDKLDVRRENLAALCQRCHLWLDLQSHIEKARRTREEKKGIIRLL